MDIAMERVLYGTPRHVCDGDGRVRLPMFMLRAHWQPGREIALLA